MRLLMTFLFNLVIRRWRILLMIVIFITIPLLLIQYAMLKEQSLDSNENWYIFDERNIINEEVGSDKHGTNQLRNIVNRIRRPADYCNLPLAKFHEDEKALGKDWKLKNVFIFLRHGQRASSTPVADSQYEYHINCSLKQFPLFRKHDWKRFIETVNRSASHFKNAQTNEKCTENQMTLFGILQMFMLGSRLKKAYDSFLNSNLVDIFSTSYQRSILSGEIIQHLLVKDVSESRLSSIKESPSLIFCRPSKNVSCQCPSLRYSYAKYNRHLNYLTTSNVKCTQLVKHFNSILLGNGNENPTQMLSLSTLFDIVSAALCASNLEEISDANVFCWPSKRGIISQEPWGYLYKYSDVDEKDMLTLNRSRIRKDKLSDRCFSLKLLVSLWQCYDERTALINMYPDFRKYAKLASYPILKEILNKVYERNEKVSNISKKSSKFIVYVGHDHSLRFLLGSLNYNEMINVDLKRVLNVWPGFASRLVMEVFENVKKRNVSVSELKFRLLYNGLDITSTLDMCASQNNGCDFHIFKNYLSGVGYWESDLFGTTSYSHECNHV